MGRGEEDTNEARIMTRGGTVTCHSGSVKRKPDGEERWDSELWKEVQGTPLTPDPNRETYRMKTKVVWKPEEHEASR